MKKNGVHYNKQKLIKMLSLIVAIIIIIFAGEIFYDNLLSKNVKIKDKKIATTYSSNGSMEIEKYENVPEVKDEKIVSNKNNKINNNKELSKDKQVNSKKDNEENLDKNKEQVSDKDNIDSNKDKEESVDKKIAYLTFDDGPSAIVTPKVLDVLKAYDIKATFFVLGKNVEENPNIFKRIIEEGHGIANHSYSHNYKQVYNSVESFTEEIRKTNETIDKVAGKKMNTKAFRFPGGSFEKKKEYKEAVKNLGMEFYDWNCLNGDAEGHNVSKESLVEKVKKTAGNQKKLIILMHDTNAKITTVDALSETIEYLRDKGYEFRILE